MMKRRGPPPRTTAEQSYTLKEVALRRRAGTRTIRKDIPDRLKATKVGRIWRITPEALAAYERGDW